MKKRNEWWYSRVSWYLLRWSCWWTPLLFWCICSRTECWTKPPAERNSSTSSRSWSRYWFPPTWGGKASTGDTSTPTVLGTTLHHLCAAASSRPIYWCFTSSLQPTALLPISSPPTDLNSPGKVHGPFIAPSGQRSATPFSRVTSQGDKDELPAAPLW